MESTNPNIYDLYLEEGTLTLEALREIGLTDEEIANKLSTKEIIRYNNQLVIPADKLYEYGWQATKEKNYDKARVCFLKCLEIFPGHYYATLCIMYGFILEHKFYEILPYLKKLKDSKNVSSNYNFFLYIMSYIIDLPEDLKQEVKNMHYSELVVPNKDGATDTVKKNTVRRLAFKASFTNALIEADACSYSLESVFIKSLLIAAKNSHRELSLKIDQAIKAKDYFSLLLMLESEKRNHIISKTNFNIYKVCKDIVTMKTTNHILEPIGGATSILDEAIRCRQYGNAYMKDLLYLEYSNTLSHADRLGPILRDVLLLKYDIASNQEKMLLEDNIAIVLVPLLLGNYEQADVALERYLKYIDSEKYAPLVRRLIDISLIENDDTFYLPMLTLTKLTLGNYELNISKYAKMAKNYIESGNLELAEMTIDIISEMIKIQTSSLSSEESSELLASLKSALASKKEMMAASHIISPVSQNSSTPK